MCSFLYGLRGFVRFPFISTKLLSTQKDMHDFNVNMKMLRVTIPRHLTFSFITSSWTCFFAWSPSLYQLPIKVIIGIIYPFTQSFIKCAVTWGNDGIISVCFKRTRQQGSKVYYDYVESNVQMSELRPRQYLRILPRV